MITQKGDEYVDHPPSYDHMDSSDEEVKKHRRKSSLMRHRLKKPKPKDYAVFSSAGKGLESSAEMAQDGRINVALDLKNTLPDLPADYANSIREFAVDSSFGKGDTGPREDGKVPKLSIVIMIVGSRGDVQPFLALGQELTRHGHRVRIATHGTFRTFVTEANLEFFNIGGDPHDLMSYMVKNPGLIPGWSSLTNGDIGRKRRMLSEIMHGCWDACSQSDDDGRLFIADAIISNPPAFAHVHCAEALGIPLQLSFTMPWCPTAAFPHPLVNISQSNAEPGLTNYLSYALAELMTWQGLGDVINNFRKHTLGLEPLSVRSGPGIVDSLKVPWTYCFSPEIVPKPEDWKNHIDVVGFYFLELAQNYKPAADLLAFLEAGPPPIYIGFGSVVVEDPEKMTETIFQATAQAGVRALVSAGWGGLGDSKVPDHIFILGNVPHDWLFTKVFAVCHHGGAGTTAIGLRLGKPTIVVPFFGDQPFWGAMIHKSGAGPKPLNPERLNVEKLKRAILFCTTKEAAVAAEALGRKIRAQNGVKRGVDSFHRHLPIFNMRCDLLQEELAVWWSPDHCLRLSAIAARVLNEERLLDIHKLEIHRAKEYDSRAKASNPLSCGVIETFRSVTKLSESLVQLFTDPQKGLINTTIAIPRSILEILDTFAEGMTNTPALYGSPVRQPGRVKGVKSGFKEGGRAFAFGVVDGITGLWTEPAQGFKAEGIKGFFKGSARSYVNAGVRPAAGALNLVTMPIRGIIIEASHTDPAIERRVRHARMEQGMASLSSHEDKPKEPKKHADGKEDEEEHGKSRRTLVVGHREESFEQHLRGLRSETFNLSSTEIRAKIMEHFNIACQKDNYHARKKAIEQRIQWIILKGKPGSISQGHHDEDHTGQKLHLTPIYPSSTTLQSTQPSLEIASPTSTYKSLVDPISEAPESSYGDDETVIDKNSIRNEQMEATPSKPAEESKLQPNQPEDVQNVSGPSTGNEGRQAEGVRPALVRSLTAQEDYENRILLAAAAWSKEAVPSTSKEPKEGQSDSK